MFDFQKKLEVELSDKILQQETRAGIFAGDSSGVLKQELYELRSQVKNLSDENKNLVRLNDEHIVRNYKANNALMVALEDKQTLVSKNTRKEKTLLLEQAEKKALLGQLANEQLLNKVLQSEKTYVQQILKKESTAIFKKVVSALETNIDKTKLQVILQIGQDGLNQIIKMKGYQQGT